MPGQPEQPEQPEPEVASDTEDVTARAQAEFDSEEAAATIVMAAEVEARQAAAWLAEEKENAASARFALEEAEAIRLAADAEAKEKDVVAVVSSNVAVEEKQRVKSNALAHFENEAEARSNLKSWFATNAPVQHSPALDDLEAKRATEKAVHAVALEEAAEEARREVAIKLEEERKERTRRNSVAEMEMVRCFVFLLGSCASLCANLLLIF